MDDDTLLRIWVYTLIAIFLCVTVIVSAFMYTAYTFRIGGYCEGQRLGQSSTIWVKCDSIQKVNPER